MEIDYCTHSMQILFSGNEIKREKHVDALAHEHPFYFPYYKISYETILIF